MVTPNPNLIVEIQLGAHKNKILWQSSSPYQFSHPYGWTLSRNSEGFRLDKPGRELAVEFTLEQGEQGFIFESGRGDATLYVRPAKTQFQDWLELNSSGAGNGSELMILRGSKTSLTRSTVVSQSYECGQFSLRRAGNGWQITALDPSVKVLDGSRPLQINSITDLPWGSLESLHFEQGDSWWKFKRVSTAHLTFPAERFGAFIVHIAALAFAILMVSHLPNKMKGGPILNEIPSPSTDSIRLVMKSTPRPVEMPKPEEVAVAPTPEAVAEEPTPVSTEATPVAVAVTRPKPVVDRAALRKAREEKRLQQSANLLKAQLKQFEQKTPAPNNDVKVELDKRTPLLAGPIPWSAVSEDPEQSKLEQIALKNDLTRAPSASSGISRPQSEENEVSEALKIASQSVVQIEDQPAYTIHGGLTQAQVEAAVVKQIDSIRTCYESALGRKSGLSGRMSLSFVIGKGGTVEAAKIAESNIDDQLLQKCVVKRLAGWTFPTPSDSKSVSVSYPFLFKTVGVE